MRDEKDNKWTREKMYKVFNQHGLWWSNKNEWVADEKDAMLFYSERTAFNTVTPHLTEEDTYFTIVKYEDQIGYWRH